MSTVARFLRIDFAQRNATGAGEPKPIDHDGQRLQDFRYSQPGIGTPAKNKGGQLEREGQKQHAQATGSACGTTFDLEIESPSPARGQGLMSNRFGGPQAMPVNSQGHAGSKAGCARSSHASMCYDTTEKPVQNSMVTVTTSRY